MLPRMILAVVLCGGVCRAERVYYEIRPAEGDRLALTVEKTGLMSGKKHVFLFRQYSGTLTFDPESPERSGIRFAIRSADIVCTDTWVSEKDREKILRAALDDMLAAARHPELMFSSSEVVQTAASSFEVKGTLTIRDIAKPATVSVRLGMEGERISSLAGKATVKLRDYGLDPPSAALGLIGTKNEMTVEFLLSPALERPAGPVEE